MKSTFKKFTIRNAIFFLIAALTLDLLTKSFFFSLGSDAHLGPITFTKVKNYGFIFGSLAEQKNLIRVVFFSTLSGYATALYFVLLYFFKSKRIYGLKMGLTIFLVGILGNSIDKTFYGFVRDFINIDFPMLRNYAFNIADTLLVWGTIQNIICIFFYSDDLFQVNSKRRTFLINKSYQLTMAFIYVAGLLMLCLTLSLFSYSFLRSYVDPHDYVADHVYFYFFFGIFMITSIYSIIAFLLSIMITHRSAGPLIALRRFVEQLKINPQAKLKLREEDFHKELELLAEEVQKLKQ